MILALPATDFAAAKPVVKKIPAVIKTDTARVQTRSFNNHKVQGYLQDKDFRYNKADVQGESLWDRFWHWFWNWLYGKVFSTSESQNLFYYLLVGFGAIFLIFLMLRISGLSAIQILRGEAKKLDLPYAESLENIHEINFDNEIENAIAQRNYKLAVRLLYLRSLKQLSDAQLIHWQIEKTNTAYLEELTNSEQRQSFGLLTRQFEYVWYGDFFVDGQSFQNINTLFQDFKKTMQ
ncbi:DUF4129 domain-containing protein [Mucilaginibacter sp. AW1-3]